jgi:hypothetical protein
VYSSEERSKDKATGIYHHAKCPTAT